MHLVAQNNRQEGAAQLAPAVNPPDEAAADNALHGKTRSAIYRFKQREKRRKQKWDNLNKSRIDWSHKCCWRELAETQPNLKAFFNNSPSTN